MTNEDINDRKTQAAPFKIHPLVDTTEQIEALIPCAKIIGGTCSKFNVEQDLPLVRKVDGTRAHIAKQSKTQIQFKIAAEKLTNSDLLNKNLFWNKVQDKYKCLKRDLDKRNRREFNQSELGS